MTTVYDIPHRGVFLPLLPLQTQVFSCTVPQYQAVAETYPDQQIPAVEA